MIKNFDYKVPLTEDCVLIDINNWLSSEDNLLINQKINGQLSPTFITTALEINLSDKNLSIHKSDTLLISRIASDVAPYKSCNLFNDSKKYFNLPISQILGIFEGGVISYKCLQMLSDKVLIRRKNYSNPYLKTLNSNVMVGEIVKIGAEVSKVSVGDEVFIRDNISTEVLIGPEKFYALEERMVVGVLSTSDSLAEASLINESILLVPYIPNKVLNSSILITPNIDFKDLDYSDVYNRDLFKVKYLDKSIKNINVEDVLLINRDYTNYVYYGMEKYFIINGTKYILGRIKEKNNEK